MDGVAVISVLQSWQGLGIRFGQPRLQRHLQLLAGLLLVGNCAALPFLSRTGLALILLAEGVLWACWTLQQPARPMGAMGRSLLLFLAVAVVATGFSPVPFAAVTGLSKLAAYLAAWALAARLLREAPGWWNPILAALLLGALAESVLALRQLGTGVEALATWSDTTSLAAGITRIYGSLGNPNLLGGYMVPVVPLAIGAGLAWRSPVSRLLAMVTAVLSILAVAYSYSRGAWLGLVAALGCLLFFHTVMWLRRSRRRWPLLLLLLIVAVLVLLLLAVPLEPLHMRLASMVVGRADSSTNFRMNVWTAAWRMVQDRPWLGIGPGHGPFNHIYPLYQQPLFNALSAYSMPLELAVEMGLAGLTIGVAVVWITVQRGWRSVISTNTPDWPRWSATAAVVGIMAHGLVDTIFLRPEVQLSWWLCLAVLSVDPGKNRASAVAPASGFRTEASAS